MSKPLRIMPAGDSITASSDELRGGYRGPLQDFLNHAGAAHQYVGSRTDRSAGIVDGAHEGYPGWSMDQLRNGDTTDYGSLSCLADSVKKYEPDVLLLLCGTNPMYQGDPQEVVQSMRQLVDNMFETRPQMHLFLGSILPVRPEIDLGNMIVPKSVVERIQAYNLYQAALVCEYRKARKSIHFVDHYPIVNPAADLKKDGVHPAANVFPRMAWAWFAAMKASGVI